MSKNNKHKPLSAEEMLKLLEQEAGKSNSFDEMDEFEKEAFEGFEEHTTSDEARLLLNDIDQQISAKVTGSAMPEKKENKKRIIWFAAAASLALLITTSVLLLNQAKEDKDTTIAMQEQTKLKLSPPPAAAESKPLEITSGLTTTQSGNYNTTVTPPKDQTQEYTVVLKDEALASMTPDNADALTKTAPPVVVNVPAEKAEDSKNVTYKWDQSANRLEEEKNKEKTQTEEKLAEKANVSYDGYFAGQPAKDNKGNAGDDLKKEVATATGSISGDKAEGKQQTTEESDKLAVGASRTTNGAVTQTVISINANSTAVQQPELKEVMVMSKAKTRKKTEAQKSPSYLFSSTAVKADSITYAHYTGGQPSIKVYVQEYIKIQNPNQLLLGKYKVKGTVSIDGVFKVTSITQISREFCGCTDAITTALNSMKNWNPATSDGKKHDAEVEFELVF